MVVRELLPAGQKGKVLEWFVEPAAVENWKREPVISFSQVGYHPTQAKRAVVELDASDELEAEAALFRLLADGSCSLVRSLPVTDWGPYKRYHYGFVDFSDVKLPGLYMLRYGDQEAGPIRVDEAVYAEAWHLTLDVFMPVQMDHMFVREAYRVWHGEAHRDDALQAPVDHPHFDLFGQGPATDTPFEPFEHITGLDVGGWFDAGDFDLRTQTHYYTILYLAQAWEDFHIERDETYVCQDSRYTELRRPDGKPDLLQQIEHGILALMAQYDVFGRAIPGLIVPDLSQYTHLGDAINITDNLIYRSDLDSLETDGAYRGKRDDRWAFTSKTTPLNYGSASALAAASRALKDYNDSLASACLATAKEVWAYEQSKEPDIFYVGNTTGGPLVLEEMRATVQLLKSTGDNVYARHLVKKWPEIEESFEMVMGTVVHALPFMDETFYSFIPGGIVPGVLILNPDFPENKEDWPFLWGENEYVVNLGASYLYLVHAAMDLLEP